MQIERPRWLVALALGTTVVFDVTGAVIYRVLRSSLPHSPADRDEGPFQQATGELSDALDEAISRTRRRQEATRDEDGVTLPA